MGLKSRGTYTYNQVKLDRMGDLMPSEKAAAVSKERLDYILTYTEYFLRTRLTPEEKEELKSYAADIGDDLISFAVGRASARENYTWKAAAVTLAKIQKRDFRDLRQLLIAMAEAIDKRPREAEGNPTATGHRRDSASGHRKNKDSITGHRKAADFSTDYRKAADSAFRHGNNRNTSVYGNDPVLPYTPTELHAALSVIIEDNFQQKKTPSAAPSGIDKPQGGN